MQTSELIARLTADAKPLQTRAPLQRLSTALIAGMAVSFVAMWAWLGIRADLASAVWTAAYWIKFGYTLLFSAAALWLTDRLGRPGAPMGLPSGLVAATILLIAAAATAQLGAAPAVEHHKLMMGSSAGVCPWRIVALSPPIFVSVALAMRRLAPTRPLRAGMAAGLLSGAAAAWIYAFHCDESATPFVAIWYTTGIATVGALGGVSGRWLLRW
jgi:hypothetical protein